MEIKPNKAMSPEEYIKTDDYKERAYSYINRRAVDDLSKSPIVYDGKPYCSSRKLYKKLERDFGSIKRLVSKNLWKFKNFTGKVELGVHYPDKRNVESVWLRIGSMKIAIYLCDKPGADLRAIDSDLLLEYLLNEWEEKLNNAKAT
jgi:hypothetical protein